jgi:hypothetical protein
MRASISRALINGAGRQGSDGWWCEEWEAAGEVVAEAGRPTAAMTMEEVAGEAPARRW